ncbi:MAG: DUF192 domain-containing protein [Oscillatoriophycideae cyanobacterium NC_groundwater_1537_Pr4_S-0.65um_50_18]|nr:DUF192 domain-containing protein [Oscillatoriophycideae cyanobacterium NC_groundwater_1537_Pr4_S-0.65um_50_18]
MGYLLLEKSIGLGMAVLLLGCSPSPTPLPAPAPPTASLPPSSNAGQMLPITAQAQMAGQIIQLEVAQTAEQQQMGLMYRPPLPDDRGMLFPFNPPRQVRFWMENTPSPLDMVFLYQGEVKDIAANVPPCTSSPCPTYGPWTEIDQVIELRSGRAAELGLKVGDRVEIQFQ